MPRIAWSPEALSDLDRLHSFLSEKSSAAAGNAVKAIYAGIKVIATYPLSGRPADVMPPGYREKVIPFGGSAYVVLYQLDGKTPVVLAIKHGREVGYYDLT